MMMSGSCCEQLRQTPPLRSYRTSPNELNVIPHPQPAHSGSRSVIRSAIGAIPRDMSFLTTVVASLRFPGLGAHRRDVSLLSAVVAFFGFSSVISTRSTAPADAATTSCVRAHGRDMANTAACVAVLGGVSITVTTEPATATVTTATPIAAATVGTSAIAAIAVSLLTLNFASFRTCASNVACFATFVALSTGRSERVAVTASTGRGTRRGDVTLLTTGVARFWLGGGTFTAQVASHTT